VTYRLTERHLLAGAQHAALLHNCVEHSKKIQIQSVQGDGHPGLSQGSGRCDCRQRAADTNPPTAATKRYAAISCNRPLR
jgi:hypothetical protein